MEIKILNQNLEYFKYTNNIIKADEIDNRFNDIVNYLNDEIIFKLNNVNDNIITGSLTQDDINSILKSKGDAGYIWKKINNDDFGINVIDVKKLNYKTTGNSIFRASSNGDIQLLQNQNMAINTIVCDNNGVRFDKLNNTYIDPQTKITGNKIQYTSITADNLKNITLTISNDLITSNNFKQSVITTSKIINNSIRLNSFNAEAQSLLSTYIWKSIIPKNFINLNNVGNSFNIVNSWGRVFLQNVAFDYKFPIAQYKGTPYTIPLTKFNNFYVKNIIKYYTHRAKITDLSLTDPNGKKVGAEKRYVLSPNNFKPNSINPNRLVCWFHRFNNENCHDINNILALNTLTIDHFTSAIKTKIG